MNYTRCEDCNQVVSVEHVDNAMCWHYVCCGWGHVADPESIFSTRSHSTPKQSCERCGNTWDNEELTPSNEEHPRMVCQRCYQGYSFGAIGEITKLQQTLDKCYEDISLVIDKMCNGQGTHETVDQLHLVRKSLNVNK